MNPVSFRFTNNVVIHDDGALLGSSRSGSTSYNRS